MKYLQKTFTLPASNKEMSKIDYEVALGQRCPKCKIELVSCNCLPNRKDG